jgi:hypothetical protein
MYPFDSTSSLSFLLTLSSRLSRELIIILFLQFVILTWLVIFWLEVVDFFLQWLLNLIIYSLLCSILRQLILNCSYFIFSWNNLLWVLIVFFLKSINYLLVLVYHVQLTLTTICNFLEWSIWTTLSLLANSGYFLIALNSINPSWRKKNPLSFRLHFMRCSMAC